MAHPIDLTESLHRFRSHFGRSVSGRSLFEFPASEIEKWVNESIATGTINPNLDGETSDLVEGAD